MSRQKPAIYYENSSQKLFNTNTRREERSNISVVVPRYMITKASSTNRSYDYCDTNKPKKEKLLHTANNAPLLSSCWFMQFIKNVKALQSTTIQKKGDNNTLKEFINIL